ATQLNGAPGKSNDFAEWLKALGEQPVSPGFVSGDRGEHLRALLETAEIDSDFVSVSPRTRQCITVIDESTGTQTELVEESRPVPETDYRKLAEMIHRRVGNCRAVVMSGTITPDGPADFYHQCTGQANDA